MEPRLGPPPRIGVGRPRAAPRRPRSAAARPRRPPAPPPAARWCRTPRRSGRPGRAAATGPPRAAARAGRRAAPPRTTRTKLPPVRPRRVSTSSCSRSAVSASRTVTGATPNDSASSRLARQLLAGAQQTQADALGKTADDGVGAATQVERGEDRRTTAAVTHGSHLATTVDAQTYGAICFLAVAPARGRTAAAPATDARPVPAPAISLRGVRKEFAGGVVAVHDLDLDIAEGEFVTLLGPSGSGKTTVLRMIAGFERPTAGTVALRGQDVTAAPPFDRDVHTVFQDYALFPHLTVAGNVEYPLRIAGVDKAERRERAREALATVRLDAMADRVPTALSGGQRQRVALARALVDRPAVLLLDEPLGALDLKLREQMQIELAQLQRGSGITFVLVTHDQDEALTLADRIVVFNEGRVEQAGAAHGGLRAARHRVRGGLRGHVQHRRRGERPAREDHAHRAGRAGPRRRAQRRGDGRRARLHRRHHPVRRRARRRRPRSPCCSSTGRRRRRSPHAANGCACSGAPNTRHGYPDEGGPAMRIRPMRIRAVAVVGALGLALAACGGGGGGAAAPGGGQGAPPGGTAYAGPVGKGEGKLSVLAWPGYAENGSTDPKINWVEPVRAADRLQGQRQDVRHLGRGRAAVRDRRVRRGVRLRRRLAAAGLRRPRAADQHLARAQLRRHLPGPQGQALELGRRASTTASRTVAAPTCCSTTWPPTRRRRRRGRACGTPTPRPRARSARTTTRSTSPTPPCTSCPPSPTWASRTPTRSTRSSSTRRSHC